MNDKEIKEFADTISKTKLTPEESIRFEQVMKLRGWKRLFPRIFGL